MRGEPRAHQAMAERALDATVRRHRTTAPSQPNPPSSHVLSVDVEDWFQVENYARAIPRAAWPRCELRVADNVRHLLDLLARADARATFFVLGWVAERLPDLVRDIARAGHEVASHGWSHTRSEEHTSELQSRLHLVCRLLLEKKKKK